MPTRDSRSLACDTSDGACSQKRNGGCRTSSTTRIIAICSPYSICTSMIRRVGGATPYPHPSAYQNASPLVGCLDTRPRLSDRHLLSSGWWHQLSGRWGSGCCAGRVCPALGTHSGNIPWAWTIWITPVAPSGSAPRTVASDHNDHARAWHAAHTDRSA